MANKDAEHAQALADKDWWQSMLPPGWMLHGWDYRSGAAAYTPDRRRLVKLDGELLCAFAGRDCESGSRRAQVQEPERLDMTDAPIAPAPDPASAERIARRGAAKHAYHQVRLREAASLRNVSEWEDAAWDAALATLSATRDAESARPEREYAGWLIQKHGLFYRPNWCGYTDDPAEAGRYTRTQADREAAIEPNNFKVVPAPEMPKLDRHNPRDAEIARLRAALTGMVALVDDMSRFVGSMALQDYARFNDAPIAARAALAPQEPGHE